jgi:hypothetical protein
MRSLVERIQGLCAAGGAPEALLDSALHAVIEAVGARAGAVCRLEPGAGALGLAAAVGLSDEGCRLLRWLAADGPWEAPLRCLREGRAEVSEPGALPPLVEGDGNRVVACVPLIARGTPRGTLVLVAEPGVLDAEQLPALQPAAAELAALLADDGARSSAESSGLLGLAGSLLETVAERALARIRPAVDELVAVVETTRARVRSVALPVRGAVASLGGAGAEAEPPSLAAIVAERDRLAAERAELALAQVALEQARAAEVGGLTARLAEAEAAVVRERERIAALERAQEELIAELAEAIAREQRTREEAEAVAARAAADREETLLRARETVQAAEAARAAAAVEAEALRTALAQAQTRIMEAEDDARAARAACDLLEAAERAHSAERDQLAHDLEEVRARAAEDAGRIARLEREIGALHEERLRLQASGREREAEVAAAWAARLSEQEATLARTRERVLELERAHDLVADRLAAAEARAERAEEELRAVAARAAADREELVARARESTQAAEAARAAAAAETEALRAALAQAQAAVTAAENQARRARGREAEELVARVRESTQAAEAARAAAAAEAAALRTTLAEMQARLIEIEDQARQAREAAERARAEAEALRAERARLTESLEAARARESEVSSQLATLECDLATLREEQVRLTALAREREAEITAEWTARLAEQETVVAAGRERIAELERAHVRLSRDLAEATAREQKAREEMEALLARTAADREETLARARETVQAAEAARAVAAAEVESVRAALAQAQSVVLEAEDEARQARAELERIRAEAAASGREREELRDALEEARARAAEAEGRLTRLEGEVGFLREERARLAAVAQTAHQQVFASGGAPPADAAAAPRPAPGQRSESPPHRRVVIVDAPGAAPPGDPDVAVATPGADLGERLRTLDPGTVLVNLATPGALAAWAQARAAGVGARARGFLAPPGTAQAVTLGSLEVVVQPADGRALATLIATGAGHGTRVLAAGSEAEAFLALRQALTRHGISVSIAWDAKQATDLLAMVRPQIVVLDFGLPPRGGAILLGELARAQPLPDLVCLLRDEDPAPAVAAELPALLAGPMVTTLERVIARARGRA